MPTVCVYRPNRSESRPFTARDAARVAKYAARRYGAMNVAAAVIASLELDDAVCILDCCERASQLEPETLERQLRSIKQEVANLRRLPFIRHPIARGALVVVKTGLDAALSMLTSEVLDTVVELDCASRQAENAYLCALINQWKTEL